MQLLQARRALFQERWLLNRLGNDELQTWAEDIMRYVLSICFHSYCFGCRRKHMQAMALGRATRSDASGLAYSHCGSSEFSCETR